MVTQRRIEFNPDQIKVVVETSAPSPIKELQHLTSRLAALECFIACFMDKLRFFSLTLKGASATRWTSDYERAFGEIKCYVTQPPILSSPQPDKQLYMYLAASDCAISVVFFLHEGDKEHRLIYYVSKAMDDAKTRYTKVEQTTLALKSVAQKLCPYFSSPLGNRTHEPIAQKCFS